jgi:predicted dehydrogenase
MKNKIAFIGSGKVATFHIEAALRAGFIITSISATDKSKSALEISKKYDIPNYFERTEDLLSSNKYDCLSVITPPSVTIKLLELIENKNVPALIEKPGALNSISLNKFIHLKNIFVGYNRRYYKTIQALELMSDNRDGLYTFSIIETAKIENDILEEISYAVLNNSVHILDLINYLLGKCEIRNSVYSKINHNLNCRIYQGDNFIGNLTLSFNSIKNTSIEFDCTELNVNLSPIEKLQVKNEFAIIPPDRKYAYNRYETILNDTAEQGDVIETGELKPGFLGQYIDFLQYCNMGIKPQRLASLEDAVDAIRIAESVINQYRIYIIGK